ncbi:GlyGly-CTERM sorting domain-containing protein, partial [Veronia pacifica]
GTGGDTGAGEGSGDGTSGNKTPVAQSGSSGGGSLAWFTVILMAGVGLFRRVIKKD